MPRIIRKPKETKQKFIAVVVKATGNESGRPHGDWAAFVADDRDTAVRKAIEARDEWIEASRFNPRYDILVGTLTSKVEVPPTTYQLTTLE